MHLPTASLHVPGVCSSEPRSDFRRTNLPPGLCYLLHVRLALFKKESMTSWCILTCFKEKEVKPNSSKVLTNFLVKCIASSVSWACVFRKELTVVGEIV